MHIHTGVKPHGCGVCGKKFIQAQNLKEHALQIHTGEKPHASNVCGKHEANTLDIQHPLRHTCIFRLE